MSRVALVVGGGSGIGFATCASLAAAGHTVALADLVSSESALARLTGSGHRTYETNVANEASVIHLFDSVETDLGDVAVLVNCAGITGYVDGTRPALRDMTLDNWNQVFNVNTVGSFLCVREMLRRRSAKAVDHARIVLTGSMAAQDGGKNSPSAYVASKGAVHALVKSAMNEAAALEMTINCVAPGVIDTPLLRSAVSEQRLAMAAAVMPLGRTGTPQEVAAAITFLASIEASFVTGACIDVNGGMRLT